MKIEILTEEEEEDIIPVQAEKMHGFAEGFAECVRNNQKVSHKWGWCTVVVRVTANGVGEAALGGCSYKSASDFVENSGYFSDLVRDAIADIE